MMCTEHSSGVCFGGGSRCNSSLLHFIIALNDVPSACADAGLVFDIWYLPDGWLHVCKQCVSHCPVSNHTAKGPIL